MAAIGAADLYYALQMHREYPPLEDSSDRLLSGGPVRSAVGRVLERQPVRTAARRLYERVTG